MLRPLAIFFPLLAAMAVLPVDSSQAQSGGANSRYRHAPSAVFEQPLPPPGSAAPLDPDSDDALDSPPQLDAPEESPALYGHQLDDAPPFTGNRSKFSDPDMPVRPPADVGTAHALPPAVSPPTAAPPNPVAATAALPPEDRPEEGSPKALPPNLQRQLVDYQTREPAGTLIVDTPNTYLYLVLGHGKALRYGIGVGREGFTWTGTERISRMKEWPDWFPPPEMIERQPYLPRMMAGGPGNPLGARALYLGHTLYRIHGTNQPSTIGSFVSSGCIRLINEDIEDLYSRIQVGTRVVVLPGKPLSNTAQTNTTPGASATGASVMVESASGTTPVPPAPLSPLR